MNLSGKVALVTGASRGIGREISRQLAEHRARIAVHFKGNEEAAHETLRSLAGGPHALFRADVADPNSARDLVDSVAEEMGGPDVLVNNAGIFEHHPIPTTGYEAWQDAWSRTLGTNLIGPANLSFCAARRMMERGGGSIVNVSSRGAFRGEPDAPAYGASKAGLNAMSQSVARALVPTTSSSTPSPPASSRPRWRSSSSPAPGATPYGRRVPWGASPAPRSSPEPCYSLPPKARTS